MGIHDPAFYLPSLGCIQEGTVGLRAAHLAGRTEKPISCIPFKASSRIPWRKLNARELEQIKEVDRRRYVEVMTFLDDYHRSIAHVSSVVRSGGRVCYVVGNRTVKGIQIPLDHFTAEMFEQNGFRHEHTYVRSITGKRMPSVTSPSNKKGANMNTMHSEYIVILKKE